MSILVRRGRTSGYWAPKGARRMSIVRSSTLATPFLLAACATAGGPETSDNTPSSFEEFEASTYREPWEGGLYIVDGDTPVTDQKALRELWEHRFAGSA